MVMRPKKKIYAADYWLKELEQSQHWNNCNMDNCKYYWTEIELLTKSIAVYERNNFITNLATSKFKMSDQCFNHCFGCTHCITMVLLQQLTMNSSYKYYGLFAMHPIIRNKFVMKKKSVFGKILQSLCLISNSEYNVHNDYVLFQLICAIKPTQMQWIIDSQILTKLLFELNIKRDDDHGGDAAIFCYVSFILKMIKYKKKKKIVNITDQHKKYCIDASTKLDLIFKQYDSSIYFNISDMDDLKRNMGTLKKIQSLADKTVIVCGNSKCKKDYLSNKYAITETWENRKVINKWQVCHGCKLTLYCSRRCQKYDWNKGNHRIRCKFSNLYTNVIMSSDYNVI
eukprot:2637_1